MRHPRAALTAVWLATRSLMLWRLHHHWYGVLAHGAFPVHDTLWQYPPGAGPRCSPPGCCRA